LKFAKYGPPCEGRGLWIILAEPTLSQTLICAHPIADKVTQNLEIISKNHLLESFNDLIPGVPGFSRNLSSGYWCNLSMGPNFK